MLFGSKSPVTQLTKLKAYLAIPGNEKATVSDYAKHLKSSTIPSINAAIKEYVDRGGKIND